MVQLLYASLNDALERKRQRGENVPCWLAASVNVPWVPVLSSIVALGAWVTWVVHAEAARRRTHDVVDGFGLSLVREPWPLGAVPLLSAALLGGLAAALAAARARAAVQRRVVAGGSPFPSGPGCCGAARCYFLGTGGAGVVAWALAAWLVALLAGTAVWSAAMGSLHAASKAVKPPWGAEAAAPVARVVADGDEASPAAVAAATAAAAAALGSGFASAPALQQAASSSSAWARSGWAPDFPGPGRCPPTCVDLSAFRYYLGDDTCCCNVVGGVMAAEPHAAAALRHLLPALASLALLWAATSWLLLAAACGFAHSQSEALTCGTGGGDTGGGASGGAAAGGCGAAAAAFGQHPAVRALSDRLEGWLGGARGRSGGAGAARDPLLPNGGDA